LTSAYRKVKDVVSAWPNISVRPHQFSSEQFRFGNAEVGHLHTFGMLDVPFSRNIRDLLVEKRLTEEHHFIPNSGWTTFRLRDDRDVDRAVWLLRVSYLRYAVKIDPNPYALLRDDIQRWQIDPQIEVLLAQFVPAGFRDGVAS
jgi:hypothetical protein